MLVRKGILYRPDLAKVSSQDINDMSSVLFLPSDLTQLKSTIRRILVDLGRTGNINGDAGFETVDKIAKVVTTSVALDKLSSD